MTEYLDQAGAPREGAHEQPQQMFLGDVPMADFSQIIRLNQAPVPPQVPTTVTVPAALQTAQQLVYGPTPTLPVIREVEPQFEQEGLQLEQRAHPSAQPLEDRNAQIQDNLDKNPVFNIPIPNTSLTSLVKLDGLKTAPGLSFYDRHAVKGTARSKMREAAATAPRNYYYEQINKGPNPLITDPLLRKVIKGYMPSLVNEGDLYSLVSNDGEIQADYKAKVKAIIDDVSSRTYTSQAQADQAQAQARSQIQELEADLLGAIAKATSLVPQTREIYEKLRASNLVKEAKLPTFEEYNDLILSGYNDSQIRDIIKSGNRTKFYTKVKAPLNISPEVEDGFKIWQEQEANIPVEHLRKQRYLSQYQPNQMDADISLPFKGQQPPQLGKGTLHDALYNPIIDPQFNPESELFAAMKRRRHEESQAPQPILVGQGGSRQAEGEGGPGDPGGGGNNGSNQPFGDVGEFKVTPFRMADFNLGKQENAFAPYLVGNEPELDVYGRMVNPITNLDAVNQIQAVRQSMRDTFTRAGQNQGQVYQHGVGNLHQMQIDEKKRKEEELKLLKNQYIVDPTPELKERIAQLEVSKAVKPYAPPRVWAPPKTLYTPLELQHIEELKDEREMRRAVPPSIEYQNQERAAQNFIPGEELPNNYQPWPVNHQGVQDHRAREYAYNNNFKGEPLSKPWALETPMTGNNAAPVSTEKLSAGKKKFKDDALKKLKQDAYAALLIDKARRENATGKKLGDLPPPPPGLNWADVRASTDKYFHDVENIQARHEHLSRQSPGYEAGYTKEYRPDVWNLRNWPASTVAKAHNRQHYPDLARMNERHEKQRKVEISALEKLKALLPLAQRFQHTPALTKDLGGVYEKAYDNFEKTQPRQITQRMVTNQGGNPLYSYNQRNESGDGRINQIYNNQKQLQMALERVKLNQQEQANKNWFDQFVLPEYWT